MHAKLNKQPKTLATALMLLFPVSFLIAMPWLRTQPETTVYVIGGIAATGTVISSFVLAVFKDQDLDEWHRSAARFSNQWGWLVGSGLIAIAQGIPAFRNLVIEGTMRLAGQAGTEEQIIHFAFMWGFMAVVIAQMICIVALNKGWRLWMSREAS